MKNEIYYLVRTLRDYRQVTYGQFDQETRHEVRETQDAANALEKLDEENQTLKNALKFIHDDADFALGAETPQTDAEKLAVCYKVLREIRAKARKGIKD